MSTVERWLSNIGLADPPAEPPYGAPEDSPDGYKCPVCNAPRNDYGQERERYDEDYDYYWGDFRVPLWIALIMQVPWRQRLDIFVIGLIVGMVISGLALLWGFVLSQY